LQVKSGRNVRWIIGAALLAAVVVSIMLLASTLTTQRETGNEIRQRFANVLALRQAEGLLVDAETGQRGYVLTGTPAYLEPYQRARQRLPGQLDSLAAAGVVAPTDAFATLAQAKMQELGETVQLASGGDKGAALAIVDSGAGKRYMDEIRTETARLVALQQRALNAALQRTEQYTVRIYLGLALLALSVMVLLWLGLRMMLRAQELEAEAVRLREVEAAEKQTALIARELNHRVKNLFSVVLAIVQLSGRGATSAQEAVVRIRERIQALGRAHEVSLGENPMAGFKLEDILKVILSPYVSPTAELVLEGPAVELPAMRATPIGLIFHELATNALKYGAWSANGGKVTLNWSVAANSLRLSWEESGSEPLRSEGESGFGTKMIGAAVAQLGGTIARERGDHGLKIVIGAPLIPVRHAAA
jgi:two-component sensor histidine kinase